MKRLSLKSPKFKKKKPESPQTKLLRLIFERHGGIAAVAKKLKISKQLVFIWRANGRIPLSRISEVSQALQVPRLALNYKEYSKFTEEIKSWEDICKECSVLSSAPS